MSCGALCQGTVIMPRTRIMWIERKDDLSGPARIGRVTFSKSGKSIYYRGKTFHSLSGSGYKANYYDSETKECYWITGCRKDGVNALYPTDVEVDDDVREEYWRDIRNLPENIDVSSFHAKSKYTK